MTLFILSLSLLLLVTTTGAAPSLHRQLALPDNSRWVEMIRLRQHPDGCAQPRLGTRRVYLEKCNPDLAWSVELLADGQSALYHSALDHSMCLRAGGDGYPYFGSGTPLRLYPCDENDVWQHHTKTVGLTGHSIHFANDKSLCMEEHQRERGVRSATRRSTNGDALIMNDCDPRDPAKAWDLVWLGIDE